MIVLHSLSALDYFRNVWRIILTILVMEVKRRHLISRHDVFFLGTPYSTQPWFPRASAYKILDSVCSVAVEILRSPCHQQSSWVFASRRWSTSSWRSSAWSAKISQLRPKLNVKLRPSREFQVLRRTLFFFQRRGSELITDSIAVI